MKKVILFFIMPFSFLFAGDLKCDIENEAIYCRYFIDRSDDSGVREIVFYWLGPDSPADDREKGILIPPYHGSAYDFRFLEGRKNGKWRVIVKEIESNKTAETTFTLKESEVLP